MSATHATHPQAPESVRRYVRYGSSPRGAQALVLAAKVLAIVEGRGEVTQADLQAAAHPALRHRMVLNFEGQAENVQADRLIDDVLAAVLGVGSAQQLTAEE